VTRAILTISEKAYAALPGEFGAMIAGLTASSLIGGVYLWPLALLTIRSRKPLSRTSLAVMGGIVSAPVIAVVIMILVGNTIALAVATSALVVSTIMVSAVLVAFAARKILGKFRFQRTSQ
jgi:hypothetical protein